MSFEDVVLNAGTLESVAPTTVELGLLFLVLAFVIIMFHKYPQMFEGRKSHVR